MVDFSTVGKRLKALGITPDTVYPGKNINLMSIANIGWIHELPTRTTSFLMGYSTVTWKMEKSSGRRRAVFSIM